MKLFGVAGAAILALALAPLAACTGDDTSGGSSSTGFPDAGCSALPCKVGAICTLAAQSACDGTWYCWADEKWHCAPPEAGGPGGPPPDSGSSD